VWLWNRRYSGLYLIFALAFVGAIASFYDRHTEFTSLEVFGDRFAASRLPQLHDVPIYTYRGGGYDGQFYAQIAAAGNPLAPSLPAALDSPAYRSRRVLIPVLAHLAGLGHPAWVLNAFALSNLACWLILAWCLARWWFPPDSFHNLLRWVGTLFGAGMIVSVTHSLTDGPALLFISVGVRSLERRRGWLGATVLGLAGLVRETSVVCVAAFLPPESRNKNAWLRAVTAMAACVLPATLWIAVLYVHYGRGGGTRNFALPFAGLHGKVLDIIATWRAVGFDTSVRNEAMVVIALSTQVAFIAWRPNPGAIWWRIGAAFAAFWTVLGAPVWESTPSAAARAVLPLTLAFNVLVPRSARGLALLAAGNLAILSLPSLMTAVPSEQTVLAENVSVRYGPEWYGEEHLARHTWRWARASATITLHNPHSHPFRVTLDFALRSISGRVVAISASDTRDLIVVPSEQVVRRQFGPVVVAPGDVVVTLKSDEPAEAAPNDGRHLAFALFDLNGSVVP
jgi:hypothetical protein